MYIFVNKLSDPRSLQTDYANTINSRNISDMLKPSRISNPKVKPPSNPSNYPNCPNTVNKYIGTIKHMIRLNTLNHSIPTNSNENLTN